MNRARFRPSPRHVRRIALILAIGAVPLLLLFGGWLWARSDGARDLVLAKVRPRLEARLGPVQLGETWVVGPGGVALGPLTVQGPGIGRDAPPLLSVQRISVRPRWSRLLRGEVSVSSVTLQGATLELGPRAQRKEALEQLLRGREGNEAGPTPEQTATARALPRVRVEGAVLGLGEGVSVGPAEVELEVTQDARGRALSAGVAWADGTASAWLGRAPDAADWEVELRWSALPLAPLAQAVRPGLIHGGQTWGELTRDGEGLRFDVTVADVELTWTRLSPEPIGPWRIRAKGTAIPEAGNRRVRLPELVVLLGSRERARLEVTASLPLADAGDFAIASVLAPTSFQELLAALPDELAPREDVGHIDGPISATLEARGPLHDRAAWEVEASLDLEALRQQARASSRSPLASSFLHRPLVDEEARGRQVQVGPENPFYVPLGEVPRILERAVLLSEDSFFHTHPGFDVPSLVRNLLTPKEGPVVRGGSTLTQQLAKNLYLSREKTFARKAREALLTIALEASLPKDRLLEIYLNVIEWGPDVYGLGEAAWHYFGKDARRLTTREAVFLATIIPNPIRYHGYCSRNELTPVWEERMADLIGKLASAGDLDPVGAAMARFETLSFQHRPRDEAFFTDDDGGTGAADGFEVDGDFAVP